MDSSSLLACNLQPLAICQTGCFRATNHAYHHAHAPPGSSVPAVPVSVLNSVPVLLPPPTLKEVQKDWRRGAHVPWQASAMVAKVASAADDFAKEESHDDHHDYRL